MLLQRHRVGKGDARNACTKAAGIDTQQKYPRMQIIEKKGIKLPDRLLYFGPLVGIDNLYRWWQGFGRAEAKQMADDLLRKSGGSGKLFFQ